MGRPPDAGRGGDTAWPAAPWRLATHAPPPARARGASAAVALLVPEVAPPGAWV